MSGLSRYRPRSRGFSSPRRRPLRFVFDIGLTFAILGMLALVVARVEQLTVHQAEGEVVVHDGDTVTLAGERIRLAGIDAPEYAQLCQLDGDDYACGHQARDALVELVNEQRVICEGSEHDRYGRLLAVCRAGGGELNRALVEAGWAVAYGRYDDAERAAREARRGMWSGTFERPRDWRDKHSGVSEDRHGGEIAGFRWLREFLRTP